jgi:hypothetical protein
VNSSTYFRTITIISSTVICISSEQTFLRSRYLSSFRSIPCLLWNHVHKMATLSPTLNEICLRFILVFYSHLRLSRPIRPIHSSFSNKTLCSFLISLIRVACPVDFILFDMMNLAISCGDKNYAGFPYAVFSNFLLLKLCFILRSVYTCTYAQNS